jgi:hypothetical protein
VSAEYGRWKQGKCVNVGFFSKNNISAYFLKVFGELWHVPLPILSKSYHRVAILIQPML